MCGFRLAVLGIAVAAGSAAGADPKTDAFGDPLPEGAVARLGRRDAAGSHGLVPIPPAYKTYIVPAAGGRFRTYDLAARQVGAEEAPPVYVGATVSADGRRVAVAADGAVTVRAAATGEVVGRLPAGGPDAVDQFSLISLSADGSRLAAGRAGPKGERVVVVWDVAKGEAVSRFPVPYGPPHTPVLSPDGAVVAVTGGHRPPPPAAGNPAADPGPSVRVYLADGGKELFRVAVTEPGVGIAVAFSADGKLMATGSGDGPIDLWEVSSGKPVRTLLGRVGQGHRVAFSPDRKALAAVGVDGCIERWSLPDGKRLGSTDFPAGFPSVGPAGVGFAADGRVVAWGLGGTLGVAWEAPSGRLLTPPAEHLQPVVSVALAGGGKEVLTSGADGRVVRWDRATGKPLGRLPVETRFVGPPGSPLGGPLPPQVVYLGADGRRALGSFPRQAVIDVATGRELFAIPPAGVVQRSSATIYPSADLDRAVTVATSFGPGPPRAAVWDLVAERRAAEFDIPRPGYARAVAFTPDHARVLLATSTRTPDGQERQLLQVWDTVAGKKVGEVEMPPEGVNGNGLAAAPGSAAILACGSRLLAVDYEAGRLGDEIGSFDRQAGPVGPVVFSPDRTQFAVGIPLGDSGAGMFDPAAWGVRVYDWPRGRVLRTFTGHTRPVTALRFSADGKTLASGSEDTTVLLWDVADLAPKK